MTTPLSYHALPLLADNYSYILRDEGRDLTAVVDPSESEPVEAFLEARKWPLSQIWATHHHHDHTGGIASLQKRHGCEVFGYAGDAHRIPSLTVTLEDRQRFSFGPHPVEVLFIPGHTLGHIAYYLPEPGWLFCGDTLFSLGCGRLFEGTAAQMYASLMRLAAFPDETLVFCGHEYTEANAIFALHVDPENSALGARMQEVERLRRQGKPTIPAVLRSEKAANPFLRAGSADKFAELRRRKDQF